VLVPFAPGGVVDTSTRILTNKISENKGWQFVVDNRAGANGFIAIAGLTGVIPPLQAKRVKVLDVTTAKCSPGFIRRRPKC